MILLHLFGGHRVLTDGLIDLIPINLGQPDPEMGFGRVRDWRISLHGSKREIGQISYRPGEGPCVYSFGHIGYHIDPPWRGHHYAANACLLLRETILKTGKHTVVITCDPDNIPSRRTCEMIGCIQERVICVPDWIRRRWEISPMKCRYLWILDKQEEANDHTGQWR